MTKCGKCGTEGHNARGCKSRGSAKESKKSAVLRAIASSVSTSTVTEALVARQVQLKQELATLERVLGELNAIGIS